MQFLDPTIDIAFKKVFGNQARPEILISFLNSILDLPEGEKISSVIITDPCNQPDTPKLKRSIVDVRCTDQKNRQFIIEVQVENQNDYIQRSEYYVAMAIARQLESGDPYTKIVPVIFLGILKFKLFDGDDYLSTHRILNVKTHEVTHKHASYTYIELPKFNKKLEELTTVADKWISLIKNAESFHDIPSQMQMPLELDKALELLNKGTMTSNELAVYDILVDERRVELSIKNTAIADSLKQGRKEAALAIAQQLLAKGIDAQTIAACTGLSVDELKKLN